MEYLFDNLDLLTGSVFLYNRNIYVLQTGKTNNVGLRAQWIGVCTIHIIPEWLTK